MRTLCVITLSLAVLRLGEEATRAQRVEEESAERGVLHLNATELFLEFESSYERRRVGGDESRSSSRGQRNIDYRFEESVSLRLTGDWVRPGLVAWDVGLKLGVDQERYREEIGRQRQTDSDSGSLVEYDVAVMTNVTHEHLDWHGSWENYRDAKARRADRY